jgi:3',5'-cyclic AMP phosphodiesterase CpdA
MFTLAHLSDPHLGPMPVPRLSELAGKQGLGFLNWHRKRRWLHRGDVLAALVADLKAAAPDHVAVTGDLVNISLDREFGRARAWLEALGPTADVSLVPGNHDAYVRATALHAGRYWGDYMSSDASAEGFPFVRRRGPVALVGLSTAVPTGPLLATGRLGAEQLGRLPGLLSGLAAEGLFRVVLIHHPPTSGSAPHLRRLVDAEAFRGVLAEQGTELVLHGHNHRHSLAWLEGPQGRIPAVGVPSASTPRGHSEDPAAYRLYRITGAPGAWQCEAISRGFHRETGDIVELSRQILS